MAEDSKTIGGMMILLIKNFQISHLVRTKSNLLHIAFLDDPHLSFSFDNSGHPQSYISQAIKINNCISG